MKEISLNLEEAAAILDFAIGAEGTEASHQTPSARRAAILAVIQIVRQMQRMGYRIVRPQNRELQS